MMMHTCRIFTSVFPENIKFATQQNAHTITDQYEHSQTNSYVHFFCFYNLLGGMLSYARDAFIAIANMLPPKEIGVLPLFPFSGSKEDKALPLSP